MRKAVKQQQPMTRKEVIRDLSNTIKALKFQRKRLNRLIRDGSFLRLRIILRIGGR